MKKVIVLIICGAGVLLLAMMIMKRADEKQNVKPPASISELQEQEGYPVSVGFVTRGDMEETISVDGTVESDRKAMIVSRFDRKISQIMADEGDRVKEGEGLVELENQAAKLKLAAALSALSEAQKDLERAQALFDSGAISRQALEQTKVQSNHLRATWQEKVEELGDMFISSPLTGFISKRYKEPGELSGIGEPIIEIVDIRQIDVICQVSEQYIGKIHEDQPVRIKIDAFPHISWEGTITTINPTANRISRLFNVKVHLDNPDYLLRPGMYARVTIILDIHKNTLLVPQESLIWNQEGTPGVYQVCEPQIARFQPVITGIKNQGMIEIIDGLDETCRIVNRGQDKLSDGSRIRIEQPSLSEYKD